MDVLLNKQENIYKRMVQARTNYKKSPKERITQSYLVVRIENFDKLWNDFNAVHDKIFESGDFDVLNRSEYVTKNIYEIVEELYVQHKTELKDTLKSFEQPKDSDTSNHNSTLKSKPWQIKLPKIVIPTFSGSYLEWTTFRDLFVSLIHSNEDLENVQKLHYLKGYLSGEAEQLVRQIPISENNYERCWKQLNDRYNNKKFLSHHILRRLLSQKTISSESAHSLKELMDTTVDCLSALANLGIDVTTWDIIVIHIITLKLDLESRKQWEFQVTENNLSDVLPTLSQFKDFLTKRYRALEFLDSRSQSGQRYNGNQYGAGKTNKINTLHVAADQCLFCSESHKLSYCKQFSAIDSEARRIFVQEKGICFICLGNNHLARSCTSDVRCKICKRRHHSLVHPKGTGIPTGASTSTGNQGQSTSRVNMSTAEPTSDTEIIDPVYQAEEPGEPEEPVVSCFSTGKSNITVLLATALVKAESNNGSYHVIRALVDQGSQASFVTEATAQFLGLKKTPSKHIIKGIGGDKEIISKATVIIKLKSRIDPTFEIQVKAYVLKSITTLLPVTKITEVEWEGLEQEELADPQYHTPNKIDILLGADIYCHVIRTGIKKSSQGLLIAQYSKLGWILSGVVQGSSAISANSVVLHAHIDMEADETLKRFWEIETEPILSKRLLTEEEKQCEEFFSATTTRDKEGRYIVRLPFREENPSCKYGRSREIAEKRLKALEHKLNQNKELKKSYCEVINEYLNLGHMEEVTDNDIERENAVYLPHHAVVRPDKDTTKVRVVFDASCKGKNGVSLNDTLMVGPTIQPDLRHIIMRWRVHPICLVSDIIKMYRQVRVNKSDVIYQRLLWRDCPENKVKDYQLATVTFGTAAAPYLAVRTLQQVAEDEGHSYPIAAKKVFTDFYMDDLMTGAEDVEEGAVIYQQMNALLGKAGFKLQKWSSNSDELLTKIKEQQKGEGNIDLKLDSIMKILGLYWNRRDDTFQYSVTLPPMKEPVTKRNILSDIARLFDPLGWVAPSIILAKIIIQKLWLSGLGWDEQVPENIRNEWVTYRKGLALLTEVNVPRWMNTKSDASKVELHGFCDASKVAYAAVIYIRVENPGGKINVVLVTAKTKVAPIKQVSIPRLELCGAVMLTKLLMEVANVLGIDKTNLYAWTDSEVVLAWLKSHPSRWKTFVANRVSEILTKLDTHNWAHVPSKQNPADCASRGLNPNELLKTSLWFSGPEFLKQEPFIISKPKSLTTELEEVKVHTVIFEDALWTKYSSLSKLLRVIAYCRRFLNARKPKTERRYIKFLTKEELSEAMDVCIKRCQLEAFQQEIEKLKRNEDIKSKQLKSLNVFLDNKNIMRVGGRLERSQLTYDQKHPIVVPKISFLTKLIVSDSHYKTLHGGPQLMQTYLRTRFFILGVKNLTKQLVRKCVTCAKTNAAVKTQLMGQLPAVRVTASRPFSQTGVDYAGPINIRTSKGRGHHSYKGYICLFVCMATRAIHLEAVSDLSSKGFLAAFRRFVARRGHCSDLYSDNGTNFIGAARELKLLVNVKGCPVVDEIADWLGANGTNWHFIPPHAPNFGGLWEAGIKSTKYHLKRVIGNSTLTYEELSTVLAQVEACLNSRPLSKIVDESQNWVALTPGHFLVGEPLVLIPDASYEGSNISNLRRWQLTQRMMQDFWRRWSMDYLNQFVHRYKWAKQNPEPNVGDIVLIKEDNLPPCKWLLGKVDQKHPGLDNITRVVTLRVKNSLVKRPVAKLSVLPMAV